ncbi:hypothetical protein BGZ81_008714 [Podila clonocystis]|nr:hypothetical protein BGZ81_008714 [Podila clonocystis]
MRFTPLSTLVLLTLTSWALFCHAGTSGLLEVISPKDGSVYKVGNDILAQVRILDGELKKQNPMITLTFQRAIPRPDVNEHLETLPLNELSKDGYEFEVLKDYQVRLQLTLPSFLHRRSAAKLNL